MCARNKNLSLDDIPKDKFFMFAGLSGSCKTESVGGMIY